MALLMAMQGPNGLSGSRRYALQTASVKGMAMRPVQTMAIPYILAYADDVGWLVRSNRVCTRCLACSDVDMRVQLKALRRMARTRLEDEVPHEEPLLAAPDAVQQLRDRLRKRRPWRPHAPAPRRQPSVPPGEGLWQQHPPGARLRSGCRAGLHAAGPSAYGC